MCSIPLPLLWAWLFLAGCHIPGGSNGSSKSWWHLAVSCCAPSLSAGTQDLEVPHVQLTEAAHARLRQQPLFCKMIPGPDAMAEAG